ncbi:hypothetical protein GCM10025875_05770 [Litorihabitans aurantiacus]|uniref:Uncharacterized protein n=1 Tax=Litorihabitans aurantiacus TaxID=1930061 RepID=A0AA37XD15_9MICO|nr:hypothetical protein GCM10025875_05770 [Litorihabitans aurantiacus]
MTTPELDSMDEMATPSFPSTAGTRSNSSVVSSTAKLAADVLTVIGSPFLPARDRRSDRAVRVRSWVSLFTDIAAFRQERAKNLR